ncbi:RimK family alpha-L-glutamate ligase [Streptomyces sp. NPDC051561]|uniref:RimK family alpha-L-glutamate ligase n=1 Tax=Streptomyces sp. NPDC051561 TaxID=3365658 RepID=UPI0037B6C623
MHESGKGTPTVALVTSGNLADYGWQDADTPAVRDALARRGVDARIVSWHDGPDWADFDLVVLRSPWDLFIFHPDKLLRWVDDLSERTRVLNPPAVMRQVLDKRYLQRLADAGVAVVPTRFLAVGDEPAFPEGEFVVKPVTSGGARDTARYGPGDLAAARAHLTHLYERGMPAMVQPYLTSVDTLGERALIWIGGSFDHAIVKGPVLAPGVPYDACRPAHPDPRPYRPTNDDFAVARAALKAFAPDGALLSARVDLVLGPDGAPLVMELELISPDLFLSHSPGSVERFADAVLARLTPFGAGGGGGGR